jgi:nitrous-oxide reductase
VNQGDKVVVHITNIEQTTDELHGFGLVDYNLNIVIDPGETKTVEFVADKAGVYPYYCTNFCSALHQEMQGYMLVKPRGAASARVRPPRQQQVAAVPQLFSGPAR